MEDVAVYGYITPLKTKIVLALGLTDSVIRDADIIMARLLSTLSEPALMSRTDFSSHAHGILPSSREPIPAS